MSPHRKMTVEEKKAHSERLKASWARRKAVKPEIATELPKVVPDMKTPDIQAVKVVDPKIIEVSKEKSFLEVENVELNVDGTEVHNLNPNYYPRWCRESELGNGRKGIWVVLNRNHPDFAGVSVNIDHSPDKSFIRFKDLILCVTRKETRDKKRKALDEKVASRTADVSNKLVRNVERVNAGLANRSGVVTAFKGIDKEYKKR